MGKTKTKTKQGNDQENDQNKTKTMTFREIAEPMSKCVALFWVVLE